MNSPEQLQVENDDWNCIPTLTSHEDDLCDPDKPLALPEHWYFFGFDAFVKNFESCIDADLTRAKVGCHTLSHICAKFVLV